MTISEKVAEDLESLELPVGLDVLERNVEMMAERLRCRGVSLRPHFKMRKVIQVASIQRQHGSQAQACATLGEAKVLAEAGAGSECSLRVLVEVNSGGWRVGVRSRDAGVIETAAERAGIDVVGVDTHGGHVYGLDGDARRATRNEVEAPSVAADTVRHEGIEARVVSGSSAPTAMLSTDGLATEEGPGTYMFQDRQQAAIGSCEMEGVALRAVCTFVGRSVDRQFVVEVGTKCLGPETQPWLDGYAPLTDRGLVVSRLYDHHGVVPVPSDVRPCGVGTTVTFVPNHVCRVVKLARYLAVVRDGRIVDRWDAAARALT